MAWALLPQTCSNLLNLDLTVHVSPHPQKSLNIFQLGPHYPPENLFKHVHYDVRTVGERAVVIRLKCLLV